MRFVICVAIVLFQTVFTQNANAADPLAEAKLTCKKSTEPERRIASCTDIIESGERAHNRFLSYVFRGLAYFDRNNFAAAARDFTSAMKLKGETATLLAGRAQAYSRLGNAAAAWNDIKKATQKSQSKKDKQVVYTVRCEILAQKHDQSGIAECTLAEKFGAQDANIYINRANLYRESKMYDEAIKDFEYARKLNLGQSELIDQQIQITKRLTGALPVQAPPLQSLQTKSSLSSSEKEEMRSEIMKRWDVPETIKGRNVKVTFVIQLRSNGKLDAPPIIAGISPNISSEEKEKMITSATLALYKTEPFLMLSPNSHNDWKKLLITFDASENR